MTLKPAVSLAAVPGRPKATLEMARPLERDILIVAPSSMRGKQMVALEELIDLSR